MAEAISSAIVLNVTNLCYPLDIYVKEVENDKTKTDIDKLLSLIKSVEDSVYKNISSFISIVGKDSTYAKRIKKKYKDAIWNSTNILDNNNLKNKAIPFVKEIYRYCDAADQRRLRNTYGYEKLSVSENDLEPDEMNTIAIQCDESGDIEIRFNDNALKVSAPPATFSVCVLVTDGQNNILKPLIAKNTPLPAEGTSAFSTTKELNPAVDSSIDIHIWEGESFRNPDANNWIGCVHIKSSAMDRVLPAGTSIEIKITQDESRTNHITGYIPDADYIIPEETLRDDSERVSLKDRMEVIAQKLLQLDVTVKKLKDNDIDMKGLDDKFYNLQQQYNDIFECIDTDGDKVQLYIKEFYDVHTAILELERNYDKSSEADEISGNIGFWKNNMERYGTPEQKRRFNELATSYENADNEANRQYYYDEMSNEHFDVIIDSFEYLGNFFLGALNGDNVQYTDPQKASYWKTQAMNAIKEKNTGKLREAVFELLGLRVNSANDSINSVMADLKI